MPGWIKTLPHSHEPHNSTEAARGYVFNFEANCLRNLTTFGPTTAVQ